MKKNLFKCLSLSMAFVILLAQNQSLSAKTITILPPSIDESVFNLDQEKLDLVLSDLNVLDNYLAHNEGVTFEDLKASGSGLILNVSDVSAPMGQQEGSTESPLGIPPFWWGCVLGWVGLLLVFVLTDQNKEQTKKALTGCLISSGVSAVLYIIYVAVIVGTLDGY